MSEQTEKYIILKPIAERFNRIAKTITDDEIRSLIKLGMREQIRKIDLTSVVDEIVSNYLENNQSDILDLYKKKLISKFK